MSLMGIDIGTSGCKVLVLSEKGKLISRQSKGYSLSSRHENFFELDVDEVWNALKECIKKANGDAGKARDCVTSLSFSTQGEAVVPVDKSGRPLSPSPVSSDMRGVSYCRELEKKFGKKGYFSKTGQQLDPIHTIYKILWWRDNDPQLWKNADCFACWDTYVLKQLGADNVTDYSMAARMGLFNINTKDWDKDILDFVELDASKLPKPLETGAFAGTVCEAARKELGFEREVKCFTGAHDQACSAFGCGLVDSGVHYSVGTTECIVLVSDRPLDDVDLGLPTYPGVCRGTFVTLVGSQSGSRVLSWASEVFMKDNEREDFYSLVRAVKPSYKTDVSFISNMAGSTLFQNPSARAAVTGVSFSTGRDDFIKAILEGITFEQSIGYRRLANLKSFSGVDEIRIVGGGSTIENWVQIKSDIFGKRFVTLTQHDTGAAGAAMIAFTGESGASYDYAVSRFVTVNKSFEPDSSMASYYAAKEADYRKQYSGLNSKEN